MSMLLVANCSSTHRKPPKTKPQVMMEPPRMWSLRKRLILSASYSYISSEASTLQLNSQWAASVYQWHTNKFPSPLKIDSRDQSSRKQSPSRDHHPHDDHHRDLCASCLSFRREEKRIPSHYKCLYAFFKLCIPSHPSVGLASQMIFLVEWTDQLILNSSSNPNRCSWFLPIIKVFLNHVTDRASGNFYSHFRVVAAKDIYPRNLGRISSWSIRDRKIRFAANYSINCWWDDYHK